jgi:hypothetical protein
MRKAIIASMAALGLTLTATSQSQAQVVPVATGVVDNITNDWMPYWLAFHIAGSGSCGGWIWYSGDQVVGQPSVEYAYTLVLASKINGIAMTVYGGAASACDAYSIHLGP